MADEHVGPIKDGKAEPVVKTGKGKPVVRLLRAGGLKRLHFHFSDGLLESRGRFAAALETERDRGTAFTLVPVFIGIGIFLYFAAPVEPSVVALATSLGIAALLVSRLQLHGRLFFVSWAMLAILAGMLAAKVSTAVQPASQIERQLTAEVSGAIIGVDQNRRGSPRYLLVPTSIGDLEPGAMPRKLRISAASGKEKFLPGQTITGLARLQPVSGPVYPGGYDFSFFSWFEGLGGSGFFMGAPSLAERAVRVGWQDAFVMRVNRVRIAVESRIKNALPERAGDIAVALITGNKTGIPETVQASLRKTGLAHILAISGLHMALVTLTVIWCIRFGLAFFPSLVLNYPAKKWAVCAGFASASLYLLLSGAGVATQRAWVMISVMLLAVLMDRKAITMRSVAVSAIIILMLNPQSLFAPGFQMSFAAVASLVAGYEALNRRRKFRSEIDFSKGGEGRIIDTLRKTGGYFAGIGMTSLIAGTATSFIAAWHFHQVAPLGLLANLLAMPVVTLLVMPLVLFSMLLMPYGFEALTLTPVAWAIEQVIAISQWVESLSPSGNTGLLPTCSLALFALSLVVLTAFGTRLRLLSLAIIPLVFLLPDIRVVPDMLISENGWAIAIKTASGKLGLLYPKRNRFVSNIWLKAWSGGEAELLELPANKCDRERCVLELQSGKEFHLVYDPALLKQSCRQADILVAPRLWWVNCRDKKPEVILKRYDFEQYGAHAVYLDEEAVRVETALPEPSRPWHRVVRPVNSLSDIAGAGRRAVPAPLPGQN